LIQAFGCAALSTVLAEKKGYSEGAWFAAGFFLGIFGLIAAAGLPVIPREIRSEPLTKSCPDCAEPIRKEALLCKHCGRRFERNEILHDLLSSLREGSIHTKLKALDSLQTFNEAVVFSAVLKTFDEAASDASHLGHPSVAVMNKAAQVLLQFREQPVTNQLLALYNRGGNTIKLLKIIETLGVLKDPASIPRLLQALDDSTLRISASNALLRLGPTSIPDLQAAVNDVKGVPKRLGQKILDQLSKMR
jgi:hypothetical protein